MSKNNKKIKKLIRESVKNELAWKTVTSEFLPVIKEMKSEGFDNQNINEVMAPVIVRSLLSALFGDSATSSFSFPLGSDVGSAAGVGIDDEITDSELKSAGDSVGVSDVLLVQVINYIMPKLGIDPSSAIGISLNSLLRSLATEISASDLKSIVDGGPCQGSKKQAIGKIVDVFTKWFRTAVIEVSFEKVIEVFLEKLGTERGFLMDGFLISARVKIAEDLGKKGGIVSDAFGNIVDSKEMKEIIVDYICEITQGGLVEMILALNPNAEDNLSKINLGALV